MAADDRGLSESAPYGGMLLRMLGPVECSSYAGPTLGNQKLTEVVFQS